MGDQPQMRWRPPPAVERRGCRADIGVGCGFSRALLVTPWCPSNFDVFLSWAPIENDTVSNEGGANRGSGCFDAIRSMINDLLFVGYCTGRTGALVQVRGSGDDGGRNIPGIAFTFE